MVQYRSICLLNWWKYGFQSDDSHGDTTETDSDATFICFVYLVPYSCGLDLSRVFAAWRGKETALSYL